MNNRLIYLSLLIVMPPCVAMQKKDFPPSKEGAAAALNYILKKCGLAEIDTDETEKVLSGLHDISTDPRNTIHELMQLEDFIKLATRSAEREYTLNLQLIEAMKTNNTARIRALLDRCKKSQSIQKIAKQFLDEENNANQLFIEQKKSTNKQLEDEQGPN